LRRSGLLLLVAAAAVLLAGDTALAATHPLLSADRTVELDVQSAPIGPLVPLMELTNAMSGAVQLVAGAIGVLLIVVWDRRAAVLVGLGAMASLFENVLKLIVHRPRPTPNLVHVQHVVSGYSFPSGHATFFTWFTILVLVVVVPRLPRLAQVVAVAAGALVILVACLGRIWAGAHWPTDVAGGFLLSVTWAALLCWGAFRLRPTAARRTAG
jgi:undecaprenyl-diphosphatase